MSVRGSQKKLPHGKVPSAGIADKTVREAIMKLSENIVALEKMIAELRRAIRE
jgi:hypothetical protein